MDIDAPCVAAGGRGSRVEGVIRKADLGDFYMKGYMALDDAGPGAVETPIRLVGERIRCVGDAVDINDHLEEAAGRRPTYGCRARTRMHPYSAGRGCGPAGVDPIGADSDDSRASARPFGLHCVLVWTPERAHTAVGLDLWRVPGGGGGSGGEEALVLLDGPGIRKVAVPMAPADMSSAKAADLGVDAGELLVAGIHARS
eukprot:jgi/Tetstr1/421234/TSEL_012238.t1